MEQAFKHSFKALPQGELSLSVYNAGFQKCPPGYGWGPGVRDHYLLHYILSGRGYYETGNRTFVLCAGDCFLAPPDVPIYYYADEEDPWEYCWVGFSGAGAGPMLGRTPFTEERPVCHPRAGEELRRLLLEIYRARGNDWPAAVRMAGYLQVALGLLMERAGQAGREVSADYARQGALFLRQNYSRPIGIEEAARQVGVSRSHLYRVFRRELGMSPSTYLTRFRIHRACQLLRQSDLSVSAVAASVGYEDPLYFSRAFKREMGESPLSYRHREREGE